MQIIFLEKRFGPLDVCLFVTYIVRRQPETPLEVILAATEIKILEAANNAKLPKPTKIKTVKQAVQALAKLGGHMERMTNLIVENHLSLCF